MDSVKFGQGYWRLFKNSDFGRLGGPQKFEIIQQKFTIWTTEIHCQDPVMGRLQHNEKKEH